MRLVFLETGGKKKKKKKFNFKILKSKYIKFSFFFYVCTHAMN